MNICHASKNGPYKRKTAMIEKYENEKQQLLNLAIEQQMAAADPRTSVWVEASAGTGKTKVLSDRVLRLLLDKVDPSKILCLTYTKAAAVEMNERIAKRLSAWAVEDEDELSQDLCSLLGKTYFSQHKQDLLNFSRTLFALLLDTPGGMKIQTIHSFCQYVLACFPLEAGISPYFQVLDDRSAGEILQNLKIDLLKTSNLEKDHTIYQSVSYLIENISEYRFPEIMNMITTNRNKIADLLKKHHYDIQEIIRILEGKLGVSANLTPSEIKQTFIKDIDTNILDAAMQAFMQGSSEDLEKAKIFAKILKTDFTPALYDEYKKAFLTDKNMVRSRLATQKVVKIYPEILDFMNSEAQRCIETNNTLSALNVLLSTVSVLYIAQDIIKKYENYKNLYAVLDFEDLIVITRKLLENSDVADWVLFKLDGGIDHILIDEAQDTSPDQWAIVRALTQEFFAGNDQHENTKPRTVFVVGDRKQSIYSFQGADPKEFDKMYKYFAQRIQKFSKIHLDVSFRSTKAIMDCVNTLFDVPEAKKGVIELNDHIYHRPFRLGEGGLVEILPLLTDEKTKKNDEKYNWVIPVVREQKNSLSNTLARQIAQNIKSMVENRDILVSKNRPVCYGDFMFLVQRRNSFVEEFVRACKDIGVKVAGIDKLKLLEQISVQDLVSLGKFLLLPTDDLSLAEILKSPLFGLDDNDLFELCYNRSGSLFYNLLQNDRYISTAEELKRLLNMTGYTRPFDLFSYVLIKMNGRQKFIARMGNEVDDILDEFLNLALVFEQKQTPSLQSFISWIAKDEVVIKKEMEQGNSDTVKIMTVHGSKGLQAPIVILADTTHIKSRALKSELLWDDDTLYYPTSAANYDDVCKDIKNKNLDADFDEYRRLLYVALTRAEDRLYIAGYTKNKEPSAESWYSLLSKNICSNVPVPDNSGKTVYRIEQENLFDTPILNSIQKFEEVNYDKLLTPVPAEAPLSKPYTPSHAEDEEQDLAASPLDDNGHFYRRGTAVHKLLQYITSVNEENRFQAALMFLKSQLPDFSDQKQRQIVDEVLVLCKKYKDIFSSDSMAEVPIIGELDGKIISAKLDRLIIKDNKVVIVDYKTNRPAAKTLDEVPPVYLKQLDTYKRLLQKIYPQKQVETYILWTNTCNMMKL